MFIDVALPLESFARSAVSAFSAVASFAFSAAMLPRPDRVRIFVASVAAAAAAVCTSRAVALLVRLRRKLRCRLGGWISGSFGAARFAFAAAAAEPDAV